MKRNSIEDITHDHLSSIVQIESLSLSKTPNHPTKGYHHHNSYQIIIIKEGYTEIIINNRLHRINKGSVIMIGSQLPHGLINRSEDIKVTIIHIAHAALSWCANMTELEKDFLFIKESQQGYIFTSDSLYKQTLLLSKKLQGSEGFQRIVHLFKLLELLSKDSSIQRISALTNHWPVSSHNQPPTPIERAFKYLYNHFEENFSLTEIANYACQNPTALCRTFKKYSGLTLSEFTHRLRIEKACHLLRNSDLSVSQIAFQVGYNTFSHFSTNFQRVVHLTPTKYRAKTSL